MGLAGGVFPVGVGGPWGVGLLLGFRPGDLPASDDVVPGQLHALVVVDGFDAHDGEVRSVVERVRDGREPGTELVAEDASHQPRVHLPRRGVVDLLPTHPEHLGEDLGVHLLGRVPLLLGRTLCLVGSLGFGRGGGRAVHDLLYWGRAGEEGAQDFRDAGQAHCVAADPCPLIPNRGLREGADARTIVAEQLEVEGVGNFGLASPWDCGDPFQKGDQRGVGGGGCR